MLDKWQRIDCGAWRLAQIVRTGGFREVAVKGLPAGRTIAYL